jgi:hypothetical protein
MNIKLKTNWRESNFTFEEQNVSGRGMYGRVDQFSPTARRDKITQNLIRGWNQVGEGLGKKDFQSIPSAVLLSNFIVFTLPVTTMFTAVKCYIGII